jgi:hypothetical protein
MSQSKSLLQFAVPGLAAMLAIAIAVGANNGSGSREVVLAPMDGVTPYSADHERAQRTAPASEQAPTF